jgi:capsular polysaccharide biosynthesis protein
MNLLLGIILGVMLTIGTAFMADALTTADATSQTCSDQIVNWDIAKERLHETTASIETGWNRLKSGFRSL